MDPVHFKNNARSEKELTPSIVTPYGQGYTQLSTANGDQAIGTSTTQVRSGYTYARITDQDDLGLAHMGYEPELKREFGKWSTLSYAISILGVLGSQPATYGVPITVGGPATAVWAWAIGSCMAYIIASCVAELVSAYPTAGGMYFVPAKIVPQKHLPIWTWIIGWCNFLGQACGVASIAYTLGQMMLAMKSMRSELIDGVYGYSPQPWQIVVIALGMLVIFGCICSLTTKGLYRLIVWFAPINILATLGICIALLVLTEDKRSASFVFTDFRDGSGYGSKGWSFLLGFLNVAWVMTDYDGTTHMSEETHDAAVLGPRSIRAAVIVGGIQGFLLNIVFTFCLTETYMDDIVGSPTGLPIAQIFLNAAGKDGASIMLFFVILIQFFTGAAAMLANSRMAYAFARDEALPFSNIWSKVNGTTGTPVYAVWLVVLFCACLNLIGVGSTQTITAIFNLCAPCLDLSYIAVIFARLVYEDADRFVPGPYRLGKWLPTKPRSIIAICWVLLISVVLFCPTTIPVTATNMNYAVVVAAAVAVFALSWWFLGANKYYTGPRLRNIEDMTGVVTVMAAEQAGSHHTPSPEHNAQPPAYSQTDTNGLNQYTASPSEATLLQATAKARYDGQSSV
ncbi:putative amino acid/polyamine transporter I, amino acid permease [Septoria linicola]|nr:putative amino acid/polyamine transporter I, amino acid permease [Septoria linicola]